MNKTKETVQLTNIGEFDKTLRKADRKVLKAVQTALRTGENELYLQGEVVDSLFNKNKTYDTIEILVKNDIGNSLSNHVDLMQGMDNKMYSQIKNYLERELGVCDIKTKNGQFSLDNEVTIKAKDKAYHLLNIQKSKPITIKFDYETK